MLVRALSGGGSSGGTVSVVVPTMSDNTSPSGLAFGTDLAVQPYIAFEGKGTTTWVYGTTTDNSGAVGYMFPYEVLIKKVGFYCKMNVDTSTTSTYVIEASTDGNSWIPLKTVTYTDLSRDFVYKEEPITGVSIRYKYYRIRRSVGRDRFIIASVQFFCDAIIDDMYHYWIGT